jgi:hypothetical protein
MRRADRSHDRQSTDKQWEDQFHGVPPVFLVMQDTADPHSPIDKMAEPVRSQIPPISWTRLCALRVRQKRGKF